MASPVILSETMVLRALNDVKFLARVPELTGLQNRAKVVMAKPSGCRHCGHTKQSTSILRDFIFAMMALSEEPRGRIKQYFGVESLMLNMHNPKTSQVEVKIV